ncbi:MAG: glutamate-5-semialdehyde dehydrogenase [Clostridia bacterium]|nr:glutamate-5-semialdehyde dehydrogenase [Clostridia bacterium]
MNLTEMAQRAKRAFYELSESPLSVRNQALIRMAESLIQDQDMIFSANLADLAQAREEGLAAPLLQRLRFDQAKLQQVTSGLHALAGLPDPIGKTVFCHEITEGLKLYRVTCPIGVIGVIFESRPDALVQIASLALKSGNAALLKGGREALRTNQALISSIRKALSASSLPLDAAQLMETREDVAAMLKEDTLIDLIIPRGSNAFVRYIMDNSRIPVLGHADGVCHVYVDRDADLETAWKVALDSKIQNLSVCNAEETLLVHAEIADAFLPRFAELLQANGVEIRGDEEVQKMIPCLPATESDWSTEYLDAILSIRIVSSLQEAVTHINHYGSHHTDCIVTENRSAASTFMTRVDSAGVYLNVSTRFADGYVYGLGAEVGIATGKLHSRGPMGLDGLTTYKYKLIGHGQTMAEMKRGERVYTHQVLDEKCPL